MNCAPWGFSDSVYKFACAGSENMWNVIKMSELSYLVNSYESTLKNSY